MSCTVCIEDYNKSTKSPVVCPKCEYTACRICIRRYILSTTTSAHCMSCGFQWDRKFIVDNLTKTWVYKDYRQHQDKLAFETEKARLGEDMEKASMVKQMNGVATEVKELKKRYFELRAEINKQETFLYQCRRVLRGQSSSILNEKREFIYKCPVEDCNGMLSTQWRCKICETYVCSKCREIKGKVENGIKPTQAFPDHVCNEDTIKTVELLKKDTKNCPQCAVPIHKISGCDQMWCTKCHIAFSWKNGTIITTVIHNPHFYAYQAENGANAVRAPQDVPCGGLPPMYTMRRKLRVWATKDKQKKALVATFMNLHRFVTHFQYVDLANMREEVNRENNQDVRIKFILSQIDEKSFCRTISQRKLSREKKTAILHILELFNTVVTENIIDIYNNPDGYNKNLKNCENIRKYVNRELKKLSVVYCQTVRIIENEVASTPNRLARCFFFRSVKYTQKQYNIEFQTNK